jgi:hypothetical protein
MSGFVREKQPVCPTCGSIKTALFYTVECPRCDKPATGLFYSAYIVWTIEEDELWAVQQHPIFKYKEHCEEWRWRQYKPENFEIRRCLSYDKFSWDVLPGTDYDVASIFYRVHKTHKFDRNVFAVILFPKHAEIPDTETVYLDNELASQLGLNT